MTGTADRITCLVADDHPAVLAAVCGHLEQMGISIVARAADGVEALDQLASYRPDVALLDVSMPRLGGIDVARQLASKDAAVPIILYTRYGDRALLAEALDVGVQGFVLKEAPLDDLVQAVREVAAGRPYIDPVLAGSLAMFRGQREPHLTTREREVLGLLAEGLTNEEIGQRLFIAAETVRTHVRKAMAKLEADTRTEAVAKALRLHLIT